MGKLLSRYLLLFFISLLVCLPAHLKASDATYLDYIVAEIENRKLYEERYWHVLLHYKKSFFGYRSLIDDPKFFLSPHGKSNPKEELIATARSFFDEADPEKPHPVCRFVARYMWLKEILKLDTSRLPVPGCAKAEKTIQYMKPVSATMVFPTSHINSPASMFGHTFLTIETETKSKLLAYSVNYAALPDDSIPFLYAFKGLFGFYPGYFSILPYYAKIQEYSDVDHRDIWEYPLNLDLAEIRRMIYHVMELEAIYSDYYFFDENCSFNLLFLLESARPSLTLTDSFYSPIPTWVTIPMDTIKEVKKQGLVKSPIFRPSKSTVIRHIASLLSWENQLIVIDIAGGKKKPGIIRDLDVSPEDKIRISDLVVEYLQYKLSKDYIKKEQYNEIFLNTLKVRSALGNPDENRYAIPVPVSPENSHDSHRLGLGAGMRNRKPYQELQWRPAYHTLLDNNNGYVPGAGIIFGDFNIRLFDDEKKIHIQKIELCGIDSINPRDRFFSFFKTMSWKFFTGFSRRMMPDGSEQLQYQVNLGGGFAYNGRILGLYYMLVETDADINPRLQDNYSGGLGASLGMINTLGGRFTYHLMCRDMYYGLGETWNEIRFSLGMGLTLSTNASVNSTLSRTIAHTKIFSHHSRQDDVNLYFNFFY